MSDSEKKEFYVDQDICIGCGTCAELYGDIFEIDEAEGKSRVKKTPENPEEIIDDISCPIGAIKYEIKE